MQFDFDTPVDRRATGSAKWDHANGLFAMTTADMDFASAPVIIQAIQRRLDHGVFGYGYLSDADKQAAIGWRAQRYAHAIEPQQLVFSPGVVYSMNAAIEVMSQPGDAVVIQTPIYPPFFSAVRDKERTLVANPLTCYNGRWEMDFEHLERSFAQGAKLLLLCNPHNPVGRVWTHAELLRLSELCLRYDVRVISDEIHCDILRSDMRHIVLANLPGMQDRVVTLFSCTKSFNLAGMQTSSAVICNAALRSAFTRTLYAHTPSEPNTLAIAAQRAAYEQGGPWLAAMNDYVFGNIRLACDLLADQRVISASTVEGTYLLWLNCHNIGGEAQILSFFRNCGIAVVPGSVFGGAGYVRVNLATARSNVREYIGRIAEAAARL